MLNLQKGAQTLTKPQMKQIRGGEPPTTCKVVYQDANGEWQTEIGSCSSVTTSYGPLGIGGVTVTPFCKTNHFTAPTELSSNGGVSVCGGSQHSSNFFASWF